MERQKEVLACFKGNKELCLKKQEIIKMAQMYYFHNTDKHVGDVLSRMVNSGLLIRVSKGVFKLGNGNKKKEQIIDKNQTTLI